MSRTTPTRNLTSAASSTSRALYRRVSSCPNLPILGLGSLPHLPSQEYIPKFAFGTTMNSPHNYRSSPSSTATQSNVSTNVRIDTTTNDNNPLQSIREQMMRQEHKYSHSYTKQEPLLPPPPPFNADTSRTNDAETSTSHATTGTSDSNPHMRQPQDTLRSLLFTSAASRAEPYALSPRTPPMCAANDRSANARQLPPTPRTPGRRHAALDADAGWNRSPPRFFPRTLLPLEEASQEVTKRLRTEPGPIAVASSTSSESSSSSGVRIRPQFQSGHVLQTLASALSVPFPTGPTSTTKNNEAQLPGPPPLHVVQTSMPAANMGRAHRPQQPKKANSDITDFPSIDFASLGISSTSESKLAGSSAPRIVRSDSEQRRPRRRMSAPSA